MSDRQDLFLTGGVHCKHKEMPNGEVRDSMNLPGGTKMVATKAPSWKPDAKGDLPWQIAHVHHGLLESYQLVSGWMRMMWLQGGVCQTYFTEPGQTRVLPAGVPHIVLLGPEAVIITTSFGTPLPNPVRNDNDWWEVDEEFHERLEKEKSLIDQMVLNAFSRVLA